MKTLKKILFTTVAVACLSFAVSAQKEGDKPPKKPDPPVIPVGPKDPPKNDDKKKPGSILIDAIGRIEEQSE